MFPSALTASWQALAVVAIGTVGAYLALIVFSRIAGLRSFAQMTNFDLAATVAFGSIVATTAASTSTSLLQGVVALAVLFTVQGALAWLRRRRHGEGALDNGPLLLMSGAEPLDDHLATAQMTRNDLRSKLRLAGVTHTDQVAAVVLESTGAVSVLTRDPTGRELDTKLFASVRGRDRLATLDAPSPGTTTR